MLREGWRKDDDRQADQHGRPEGVNRDLVLQDILSLESLLHEDVGRRLHLPNQQ